MQEVAGSSPAVITEHTLVVQRKGHQATNLGMGVRVPPRVPCHRGQNGKGAWFRTRRLEVRLLSVAPSGGREVLAISAVSYAAQAGSMPATATNFASVVKRKTRSAQTRLPSRHEGSTPSRGIRQRGVVQPGRTLDWGSRSRGFKSHLPDHAQVAKLVDAPARGAGVLATCRFNSCPEHLQ